MVNKKRVITGVVLVLATLMIAVAIVAGIWYLRGDTVAMPGFTEVGVPNGPVTTKSIGPAGGSIASTDGRITVTVPPNTVPSALNFSIQPITNLAQGGMGSAYRLQPDGARFTTPIKVSFNFDAPDLKGIIPEGLAVAYQDPTGIWQALKTVDIDRDSKTLTITTTHFTDFAIWTVRLSPEKATLHVGETQLIAVEGCKENNGWGARLKDLLGIQTCSYFMPRENSWTVNVGTITMVPGAVLYTAPAKKPSLNVATVRLVFRFRGSLQKDVRTCEITIVDRGYAASGESHAAVYSGVICDLAKIFTLNATGLSNFVFEFVPSSDPKKGTVSYTAKYSPGGAEANEAGSGTYDVKGIDTNNPRIALTIEKATATVTAAGHEMHVQPAMAGPSTIKLTPAESECNKQ